MRTAVPALALLAQSLLAAVPDARLDVRVDPTLSTNEFAVTIWASAPAFSVRAAVPGIAGVFDANGFALGPGCPTTIVFLADAPTSWWDFKDRLTVVSLSDFESDKPIPGPAVKMSHEIPDGRPNARWRGFNLNQLYNRDWNPGAVGYEEEDFGMIAELGFNFVRLTLDYRYWIPNGDRSRWMEFDESGLKKIDRALEFAKKYELHVQLALYRLPGYASGGEAEPTDLFSDAGSLRVAAAHWRMLATRYRAYDNERLTFNLINEPSFMPEAKYAPVVRALVTAIREVDTSRYLFADGVDYGRIPTPSLYGVPRLGQSYHAYDPHGVTHYRAPWVNQPQVEPVWPPKREKSVGPKSRPAYADAGRDFISRKSFAQWNPALEEGVFVNVGEFGVWKKTPHAVTLYTISEDKATLEAGPLEIVVDPELQSTAYTYLRMFAPAGTHCGNVAEVEFYGVESIEKVLKGERFASEAEEDHEADCAMDHDGATYYKSTSDGGFIGLDLGTPQAVCGFRFIPEPGQAWRMQGGKVQVADSADFEDATTLYTFPWESPVDRQVTTLTFEPATGRYVRFLASNRACAVAEVEFLGVVSAPEDAPSDFVIASVDSVEGRATLTWTPTAEPQRAGTTRILRATAPGGPYAVAGETTGASWTDPNALAGVTYYYQAQFADTDETGDTLTGPLSVRLTHEGVMQLDRDASGALRAGCQPVWYDHPYGGSVSHTAAALFDGSLTTYSDLVNENDEDKDGLNAAAGIDLGEPCVVTGVSIYPRAENVGRLNNQLCWGSSESSAGAWRTTRTKLSDRLGIPEEGAEYKWYDFALLGLATNRTVFFMNDWGWGYANAAEMKIFGYRVADVAAILVAPVPTVAWKGSSVVLAWDVCANAESYRVERRENDGDWTVVAAGVTTTSFRDETVSTKPDRTYAYRIASVKEAELAYSDNYVPTGVARPRGLVLLVK